MFTGVFGSAVYNNESIADIGGHRVLKMGGSLTNYINTGKTGVPAKTSKTGDVFNKKSDKKSNVPKIIAAALGVAAVAAGAFMLVKKGSISKTIDFFKSGKAKNEFSLGFPELRKSISSKISDFKIKRTQKRADKKIANIDVQAHKAALKKKLEEVKTSAAKKVADYKKAAKVKKS